MWALFMDSAVTAFHAALLKNGKVVGKRVRIADRNMAEFAVSELTGLLKEHGVGFDQLTDIYVTTGPGSFTSLRIALVIAKTIIAKHRRIALWSASSLVWQLGGRDGFSLINARSNSWYVAVAENGTVRQFDRTVSDADWQEMRAARPHLPVWTDLQEPALMDDLPLRLKAFVRSDDYKAVVATYVKPAYGN